MAPALQPLDERTIDDVIARFPEKTGDILSILEELQQLHPYKFLPRQTVEQVADKTGVSRSQMYSVVTFYAFFNLQPQGKHTITVCRGTACHTRGSKSLLDTVRSVVKLKESEDNGTAPSFTTEDYKITVRTVACFGQCALAPVVAVDETIYGHITDLKLKKIVQAITDEDSDHEDSGSRHTK